MNSKIKEVLNEYENKNFEKALSLLDDVDADGEDLEFISVVKYDCLMKLERYDESLKIINSLIGENPYSFVFWESKVMCHHFDGDKKNAEKALGELERIADKSDVRDLLRLSEIFQLVGDYVNAEKYCDLALKIDGNSTDAIIRMGLISCHNDDFEMMNECADRLLELSDGNMMDVLIPLMLRALSENYRGCLDLVNDYESLDDDTVNMIKVGIYNKMIENLNVRLAFTGPVDASVDEALDLMFKYNYDGVDSGMFGDVGYLIIPAN